MSLLFPTETAPRTRRDRVLSVLALAALVFLVLRAARKDDGVLARNREFGARFLAHEDPYFDAARGHRVHGPYPPSYVIATVPLACVSEDVARTGWAVGQVAALAALYLLTKSWIRRAWPDQAQHTPMIFAIAILLASRFLLRDMAGGGGNVIYSALVLWGVEFALRERALLGGGLVALSLALKPNLAPFVLCLVCLRRWKALGACLVIGAGLVFVPALHSGFDAWILLVERWLHDLLEFARAVNLADAREVPDGFPLADTSMNQSVREAAWRWFAPSTASWVTRVIAFVLCATVAWIAWRARGERSVRIAVALFLPVSLLISPISWKAHHVILLPLFCVLTTVVIAERQKWLRNLIVVYYVSCVLLSEEIIGKEFKNTLQSLSIVTLGAIALFVAGVVVSSSSRRASLEAETSA